MGGSPRPTPPKARWSRRVRFRRRAAGAGLALGLLSLCVAGLIWRPAPVPPIRDLPLNAFDGAQDLRRIVVLGTSLSASSDWPARVQARLETCLGHPLELTVIAKPGAHSGWGLDQIDRAVAARPDLTLIEFSINDADLKDGLSLARSAAHHRTILSRLDSAAPQSRRLLITMSPVRGWQRLFRPRLAAYYALYPEIGAETGAGVLDLYPRWLAAPLTRDRLPDGLHPTNAAVDAVLPDALLGLIGPAVKRDCAG